MAIRNLTKEEIIELEKLKKNFEVVPLHGIIENGLKLKTTDDTTKLKELMNKINGAIDVNKNNNM